MKKTNTILIFTFFFLVSIGVFAQDTSSVSSMAVYPPTPQSLLNDNNVESGFKLAGYSTLEFEAEDGSANFSELAFNPIFLWKKSDRLFFKSELEVELKGEDGGGIEQEINLEYADMNYKLNEYATLFAGKFLTPIGTFQERFHPDWINKSVSKPIGFGKKVNGLKRLQSGSEIGVGLRGGFQLNNAKMNYTVFLSNGAMLDTLTGQLNFDNLVDNNNNKAIGGRVGFLPFSNSSLELGLSGYFANVGDKETRFSDEKAKILALDLTYVKLISGFGKVDFRGQYQMLNVDDIAYLEGSNENMFDNKTKAWYGQLAYQLPMLENAPGWLNNLELVARYADLNAPDNSSWGNDQNRFTVGLNYWVSWNSVIKGGLDFVDTNGTKENAFILIFSMGF